MAKQIWIPKRLVEIDLINVAKKSVSDFVAYCENDYESRIAKVADTIIHSGAKIIMLTGPSASGKTTTAHKISAAICHKGITSRVISLDNFYKNIEDYPKLPNGNIDYESVDALDIKEINNTLLSLLNTGKCEIPDFDFSSEHRRIGTIPIELGDGIIIIEGIHAHNPRLTELLPVASVYRVYAGLREEYSMLGQRFISTRDVRLARRMVRDSKFRGHSLEKTFELWPLVCESEDCAIKVFKPKADLLIDTSFTYELCVLAPFVLECKSLLPETSKYKAEFDKLCHQFSHLDFIEQKYIPDTSMLREFIG